MYEQQQLLDRLQPEWAKRQQQQQQPAAKAEAAASTSGEQLSELDSELGAEPYQDAVFAMWRDVLRLLDERNDAAVNSSTPWGACWQHLSTLKQLQVWKECGLGMPGVAPVDIPAAAGVRYRRHLLLVAMPVPHTCMVVYTHHRYSLSVCLAPSPPDVLHRCCTSLTPTARSPSPSFDWATSSPENFCPVPQTWPPSRWCCTCLTPIAH